MLTTPNPDIRSQSMSSLGEHSSLDETCMPLLFFWCTVTKYSPLCNTTPRPCPPWLIILKTAPGHADCIVADKLIPTSLTPDVAAVNQINKSIINGYELKKPTDSTSHSLALTENIRDCGFQRDFHLYGLT